MGGWNVFEETQREVRIEVLCRIAAQQMLSTMIPLFLLAE